MRRFGLCHDGARRVSAWIAVPAVFALAAQMGGCPLAGSDGDGGSATGTDMEIWEGAGGGNGSGDGEGNGNGEDNGGASERCATLVGGSIDADTTLAAGCYRVESHLYVRGGALLTIEPGVTLEFASGAFMKVESDGRLTAIGTADQPIVFTGQKQTPGYWGGVEFSDCNSIDNKLEYVTIEYGGGDDEANLTVGGEARVAISHCTLRESGGYGFWFGSQVNVTAFDHNAVTANSQGAGWVRSERVGVLDDTTTYAGNEQDMVCVSACFTGQDQTWPGIDVDYLVEGVLYVDDHITIGPGAQLVFTQDSRMTVRSEGALTAVGSADQPIVFTGQEQTRAHWGGVKISNSDSTDNKLEYVTIEYGGGDDEANLTVNGEARISVSNCTLRAGGGYGFSFGAEVDVTAFDSNIVTANGAGAGWVRSERIGVLDDTTTYTGNDRDVVYVSAYFTRQDQTWSGIDADYLVDGALYVDNHITVAPGARLVFTRGSRMVVRNDGALTAVGTTEQPIVFTGQEQTPGYWVGVEISNSDSADNKLEHVIIEYGGGEEGADLTVGSGTRASVSDCVFRHSAGYGVSVALGATVNGDIGTANTFADNASGNVNLPEPPPPPPEPDPGPPEPPPDGG